MYFIPIALIFSLLLSCFISLSLIQNEQELIRQTFVSLQVDEIEKDFIRRMSMQATKMFHATKKDEVVIKTDEDPGFDNDDNDPYSEIPSTARSRLVINPLLDEADTQQKAAARYILTQLIEAVYGNCPFYQDAKISHPNFASFAVAQLIAQAKKNIDVSGITETIDFAAVPLDDPHLQEAWYNMFSGYGTKVKTSDGDYPSIFDFIQWRAAKQGAHVIYVSRANETLLRALFNSEAIAAQVIAERDEIQRQLDKAKKGEREQLWSSLQTEFQAKFFPLLPTEVRTSAVSFELKNLSN